MTALGPGTRVGPYEIVGWLGAGGMGEVYRARDARLGRDVAIKVIAAAVSTPSRVSRFEREARAAAQLSHPGILSVYDIAIHDGVPYIVSELLDGESLRARLRGGPLALRKAIDIARQSADALAAAHDRGIVHRDIKPENLFVTADGRVKILDFGIAKLAEAAVDGPAGRATETGEGIAVGTAAYMAPEQVRGDVVDGRADIFSLGVVLHEMLSGRLPFARETTAETMAAILNDEPSELDAAVPERIARVIARCLEKNRATRFQSARDLAFGLEMLSGTQPAAGGIARPPSRGWPTAAVLVMAVAALAAAAVLLTRREAAVTTDPLAEATYSRLTNWPGNEEGAAISPDGRSVAFLSDKDGEYDVWIGQIGTGTFVNLTSSVAPLPPPGRILRGVGFTADGSHVWVSTEPADGRRELLLPASGGEPRPFLGPRDLAPAWAPDGSRIAFFNSADGDPVSVGGPVGDDARVITQGAKGDHNHNPAWSSDGQWIYFTHGRDITSNMTVWRVRPDGSGREQLTTQEGDPNVLAPIDPRTILYTARAPDLSGPWLWALDVATRSTRRIRSGLERYNHVSASLDGRRVVATIANPTSKLWRVPILDRPVALSAIEPYPLPVDQAYAPRFAAASLYFVSSRGAGDGLWRVDEAGRMSAVWNALNGALTEPAAIAKDGSRVALLLRDGARRRIVAVAADGTNPRTLSTGVTVRSTPGQSVADWSPDGQWLMFGGEDDRGPGLFKVGADGGVPVRMLSGRAENPVWSPDGAFILYSGELVAGRVEVHAIRADGTPMTLPAPLHTAAGAYRFTPDGRGIVYMPLHASSNLHYYDVATGQSRALFVADDRNRLSTFDVTADGRHVVFDLTVQNADVLLIDRSAPVAQR